VNGHALSSFDDVVAYALPNRASRKSPENPLDSFARHMGTARGLFDNDPSK
jgi:hypothetical protein